MTAYSQFINPKVITSTCKNTTCIQVIQQLSMSGVIKAAVIGNSQNKLIVEHTKDVAKKYILDMKFEPIIVKKNFCNTLLCSFVCNTIYTEVYDNKGNIRSIKVEKNI